MPRIPNRVQVGEVSFGYKEAKSQRITVTLPEELAKRLVRESEARTSTVSALVRDAVAEYFALRRPEGLPEFVGLVSGGDPSVSERVEEILDRLVDEEIGRADGNDG